MCVKLMHSLYLDLFPPRSPLIPSLFLFFPLMQVINHIIILLRANDLHTFNPSPLLLQKLPLFHQHIKSRFCSLPFRI